MKDILEQLERKYDEFEQSKNFHHFYFSVYQYIEFIEKIPEIKNLLEDEYDIISKSESKINKDTLLSEDDKDVLIVKNSAFNSWGSYWRLYCQIYTPIHDFKESDDPLKEQSPTAVLLLGIRTSEEQKRKVTIGQYFFGYLFGRKQVTNESLIKPVYERKMKTMYPTDMRRLHSMLINKLSEKQITNIITKKSLSFNTERSVLNINNQEVEIKLKNDLPNAHYILELIFKDIDSLANIFTYSEMADELLDTPLGEKDWRTMYRACKDIQEKVRKTTKIEDFLIIKTGITGSVQINTKYL